VAPRWSRNKVNGIGTASLEILVHLPPTETPLPYNVHWPPLTSFLEHVGLIWSKHSLTKCTDQPRHIQIQPFVMGEWLDSCTRCGSQLHTRCISRPSRAPLICRIFTITMSATYTAPAHLHIELHLIQNEGSSVQQKLRHVTYVAPSKRHYPTQPTNSHNPTPKVFTRCLRRPTLTGTQPA
jgi:hypothetical protein